jgi:hypothetical protein
MAGDPVPLDDQTAKVVLGGQEIGGSESDDSPTHDYYVCHRR